MYQEILINIEPQEKRVAIIEDKGLEEFYVERQGLTGLVGNIYKGAVESVVPAIGAAFVKIGSERNGFLHLQDLTRPDYEKMAELVERPFASEEKAENGKGPKGNLNIKSMLKPGQEILVQVIKEPLGTKGPRLTTHISLPGRYLVLLPCDAHRGISRRIQDHQQRQRLKELLKGLNVPKDMGLIVRTAASSSNKREFAQDLHYLMNLWRRIKLLSQKKPAPCLIHEEYDLILRMVRDKISNQTNKLLVDSKEEYKRILRFLHIVAPGLKRRIQFYSAAAPLFETKAVEEAIAKTYERKVVLKSGGCIMIEPTESLVAIDVNSGRFTRKKDPEETAYQVNLEAAKEIARQIRLRDIGGIIIIDFIDMRQPAHKKRVFDILSACLKRDYAKTDISAVSPLGLVEMTRQRTRKSLESVTYRACPYCQGKGLVKSAATMAILVLKKTKKMLQSLSKKTVFIFVHPEVASYLLNQDRQSIVGLEARSRVKILVKIDNRLHLEQFRLEAA